jgi:hypothetical protein
MYQPMMLESLISIETLTNKLSTICQRFSPIIIFTYNLCHLELYTGEFRIIIWPRKRVAYKLLLLLLLLLG